MARRHSSPEDFELLGMDSDPTPGDPDIILKIVQRYQSVGDDAERALNIVKRDGAISEGTGDAMDALRAKVGDDLPDKLTKTKTSYHDAAQAYSEYVPRLEEAQGVFDQAVDRARAAAPQANRTVRQLGADATDEQRAQARSTQDSIDAGQAEMGAARSLAEQARTLRESAQRRLVQVLDKAAEEAIPERNIFQKIADFFKEFPFVQVLVAAFVAILAVFFPVVGALLGGLLFVFNQVVASQTGGIKAGDFVTGLLGIIPGGALLKFGGRLAEAISPALAATVKNLPLIKKATGSIGDIGKSLTDNKVVGGFLGNPVGKFIGDALADAGKKFAVNAGIEAAAKKANGDELTFASVLGGAAAGAVAGALFKGGVGAIGKGRGVPSVEEGQSGRFGNTTAPAVGDSLGKKVSDQLGGFLEEGASVGTKIGVGVAQGGDPKEVAAGEIANGASKLAVGALGKAGLGRGIDSITDKIPFKGRPRPDATPAAPPPDVTPPASPTGPRPATPPPADTRPVSPVVPPGSPVDGRPGSPVASPPSPADPRPATPVPVNPVDVPLPPSPTVPDGASAARPVVPPADGQGG
ncbi:putative T7SS-secreted protein [Streptomyces sp. YKOK-I1]